MSECNKVEKNECRVQNLSLTARMSLACRCSSVWNSSLFGLGEGDKLIGFVFFYGVLKSSLSSDSSWKKRWCLMRAGWAEWY